jgi:NADP-dependent 3-hydroxy acid dehydrogenase YdfG
VVQAVLPQLRQQRSGRIVAVSSVAGRRSMPIVGHYAATKHALEAIFESLRYEVAPWDIKVSLVEPVGIRTAFAQHRISGDVGPEILDAYVDLVDAVEAHARRTTGARRAPRRSRSRSATSSCPTIHRCVCRVPSWPAR